jgi:1,2-diacylglycerol 3-alpha-glucosyltransferase
MNTPTPKYSVLMLAACPFPANYGTPGCIKEMSEMMAEMGHEVHLLTYPFGDGAPVRKVKVHRVPFLGWSKKISVGPTAQKPLLDFLMIFYACRLIWKYNCTIIHSHNHEGQLVGICAKILTGRRLLYNAVTTMKNELSSYNFIKPDFLARWLAGFLDWITPKFSDHILSLTPTLRDDLVAAGVPAEKITVVPAGIYLEMFDKADPNRFREALGLNGKRVVLYAGTLDSFQKVDLLIEAFAKLAAGLDDVVLLMVCPVVQAELRAAIVAQTEALGIQSRVRWVDGHPLSDLPDYLALADVAMMPRPLCPGHPIKLLNYMAMSRPIVASVGGAKGIVHLKNGLTCRDHDSDDMAAAITQLLQNPELGRQLGEAARQTVEEQYEWKTLCLRIEQIYADITKPTGKYQPLAEERSGESLTLP